MAGIYIHIPFCSEKCSYCDFFSGNQLYLIDSYVDAVVRELELRTTYLNSSVVKTIYFGGGTPSLLSVNQVKIILSSIAGLYHLSDQVEITFESNPENITEEYLDGLYDAGINRISLGVQFLDDSVLSIFNRKHTKELIFKSLTLINNSNISNLSVDIMYGVPGISDSFLEASLKSLMNFNIEHFSAYSLTVSKGSRLYWKAQTGEFKECDEDEYLSQYQLINKFLKSKGFIQYEISNYGKAGYFSKHNLSYWNQEIYLGIGVSAHSYNLLSRQWNQTNIKKYIDELGINVYEGLYGIEYLTEIQRYNEYIIVKLRTFSGLSMNYITNNFSDEIVFHFVDTLKFLRKKGHFLLEEDMIIPTETDILLGDYLAKQLMYPD